MADLWRDSAACVDADPEAFFDEKRLWEAREFCADCCVVFECLTFAQAKTENGRVLAPYGVFGGLSQAQRWTLRQSMRKGGSIRLRLE